MNLPEGFTPILDNLTATLGLIPAAIYGRVWRYCQMEDGVCRASLERIGDNLGLNKSTVMRYIKVLCDAGYLEDITPGLRNVPHKYKTTGKAEADMPKTVAENNSSKRGQSQTVAHSNATVAHSNATVAENHLKRHEESLEETNTGAQKNLDPLADIVNRIDNLPGGTGPNPEDQWLVSRDAALRIYEEIIGGLGKDLEQRKIRKDAILGGVACRATFDPDIWRQSITDSVAHNVQPGNIARFWEVYDLGGDYNTYLAKAYPKNGAGPITNNQPTGYTADGKPIRRFGG